MDVGFAKMDRTVAKVLFVIAGTLLFISSALLKAADHYTNQDWTGSITEYREYLSADDLHRACQGNTITSFTLTWQPYDAFNVSKEMRNILKKYLIQYCGGYITAIAEAYDGGLAKGGWHFCLPKGVSNPQIREYVLGYIEKRDEINEHSAVSVIAHSLSKAYTCRTADNIVERIRLDAGALKLDCDINSGKGSCIGYIQGIIDAYDNWEIKGEKRFCGAGYRLTKSSWQVLNTLLKWRTENESALYIVTETVASICDHAIETNQGCRTLDSCND